MHESKRQRNICSREKNLNQKEKNKSPFRGSVTYRNVAEVDNSTVEVQRLEHLWDYGKNAYSNILKISLPVKLPDKK